MDEDRPIPAGSGPAIVVAGFNRADSLSRLLNGLLNGSYEGFSPALHISIDQGHAPDVVQIAQEFSWPFGPKEVTLHPERLGLKDHLLWCGDLSQRYGEIILLEDDLYVSPSFYEYAAQALKYFQADKATGGISLYHYEVAESTSFPFQPLHDGKDVYFMQWPSSWGLAVNAAQWQQFRTWQQGQSEAQILPLLPEFVQRWEADSWKRLMVAFLRAEERYFVYPRFSLSTHFGEAGTHSVQRGSQQSPLLSGHKKWDFGECSTSLALYDAWFEPEESVLRSRQAQLQSFSGFEVDLYGQKEHAALHKEYVLTSRWLPPALKADPAQVPLGFAMDLLPVVQNVITGLSGHALNLVKRTALVALPDHPSTYLEQLSGWSRNAKQSSKDAGQLVSFSIVVPECGPQAANEATVASLLQQDYPGLEVIVLAKGEAGKSLDDRVRVLEWPQGMDYWQALELGFQASSSDILLWFHPGQTLAPGALSKAAAILTSYQEIDWLLLRTEERALPAQRWTKDRFARAHSHALLTSLGPGSSLIRRSLWLKLDSDIQSGEAWLCQLFGEVLPYSVDLVGASRSNLDLETWGPADPQRLGMKAERSWSGLLLSRMSRTFFLANGGLRWLHMELEQYPPVIRWDAAEGKWNMQRY